MITRLAFYDFDHTLFNSPMPEEGKVIWKQKTGEDWPHKGWWYQADSLNPEIFDLRPYPSVVSKIQKDNADPNTYTVLLTGRMVDMGEDIKKILDSHGISFDDYNFAKKPEEKLEWCKYDDFETIEGSSHSQGNCGCKPISEKYATWFIDNKIDELFVKAENYNEEENDNAWDKYVERVKKRCKEDNIEYEGI